MSKSFIAEERGAHVDKAGKKVLLDHQYYGMGSIVNMNEVLVDDGARQCNSIHAWHKVIINSGAAVNGAIFSEEEVVIRPGVGSKTPTPSIIIGDVLAKEELIVEATSAKGEPLPAMILGNIYSKTVRINGPTYIQGNLHATDRIDIKAPTLIAGRLKVGREPFVDATGRRYMVQGKASLKDTTAFGLVCNGDLQIKGALSLLEPILVVRNGEIQMKKNDTVRVISTTCFDCDEYEGNPFLCEKYLKGGCKNYEFMIPEDAAKNRDTTIMSWYWRAGPAMLGHHYLVHNLYEKALSRPSSDEFRQDGIGGIKFENMYNDSIAQLAEIDITRDSQAKWFAQKLTDAAKLPGEAYYRLLQKMLPGDPTPEEMKLKAVEAYQIESEDVMTTFLEGGEERADMLEDRFEEDSEQDEDDDDYDDTF